MQQQALRVMLQQMQQQNEMLMQLISNMDTDPEPDVRIPRMEGLCAAGKRYGISYQKMKQLCSMNKIRYIRSGRRILVNLDSLEDHLRKGEGGETE